MAQQYTPQMSDNGPRPHPYLHEPLLYITNLPPYVTDDNLACAFVGCGPFRPKIIRDGSPNPLSGTIEFRFLDRAEKALTILQGRPIPDLHPPVHLVLSSYPPTNPPTPLPPPNALPRLVKQLPPDFTDSRLYDLFRPYGALASVSTRTQFGPDTGTVEFWNEEDAIQAEEALHCAEVEGQNIAVQIFQPRRAPVEFNIAAPAFVPSTFYQPPYPTQYSPPRQSPYSPVRSPIQPPSSPFIHGPGQQVQLAPTGSGSHSGLIDPCNLFVKNLSPEIDSNALFAHFTKFGQIVSARVMRNDTGESRGFGFVSYHQPEHAQAAMSAMNGVTLGSKTIVVRLHEPKQLRQEKLAQRFGQGHNGHPRRNSSGATSPAASEAGESYSGWNSPRMYPSSNLASPALSPKPNIQSHLERSSGHGASQDRARRGSGSYYAAALNGKFNVPMNYNSLSALSPVVRKDVLSGELNRRIKALDDGLGEEAVDSIVQEIVSKSLSHVLQLIDGDSKLQERIDAYRATHPGAGASRSQPPSEPPSRPVSVPASQDSSSDLQDNNPATASAPEHPSTPVSVDRSLLTPPPPAPPSNTFLNDASSLPTTQTSTPLTQRDRILAAISKLESRNQVELTDLIMSLPKQDRAMCIFNPEVLRAKLADAKAVLESGDDDDEEEQQQQPQPSKVAAAPSTPLKKGSVGVAAASAGTGGTVSPQTPDLSFRGASAATSPAPATPITHNTIPAPAALAKGVSTSSTVSASSQQYTVSSLAKLPAAEIVRLLMHANGGKGVSVVGLEDTKADALVVKTTDEFVDSLVGTPVNTQKQTVGKQLFKILKALGVKSPHKVTVALLDQEDLRALAHLMNSYTPVLKEKALLV